MASSNDLQQVTIRRTGGLLGRTTSKSLDCQKLSDETRVRLTELIDNARTVDATPSPARPDTFAYAIIIQFASSEHEISVADPDIPNPVRELLDFVNSLTKELRMGFGTN